jgi:hypothetical protein
MKIRWTVILLGLNLLLLWGVAEQFNVSPTERSFGNQVHSFLPLSRSDWDGLGVSTAGDSWSASRDRWGHWWIKAPFDWPAKEGVISRMSGYLLTLPVDSAFAVEDLGRVGQSLHSYGLDNPRAVLQVSSGAKVFSYKIGNTTPLGNKVYVLSSDQKEIWVVDSGINEYVSYKPAFLRQEGFFPFNLMELEAVELSLHDGTLAYNRVPGSNLWQLKMDGKTLPVSDGAWEKWMERLSVTQLSESLGPDLLQQSLKGSVGMITFQTLYGRRTLYLGGLDKTTDSYRVQWEGEKGSFNVPASCMGILSPENFMDSHPFSLNPEDVSSVDWGNAKDSVSLRKLESGQWVVASLSNAAASASEVKSLLMKVAGMEGLPVIKSKPLAFDPSGEKLRMEGSGKTEELWIQRSKGKSAVMTHDGLLVYEIDDCPQLPRAVTLLDNTVFPRGMADLTGFSFKMLESPTVKNYSVDTPQGRALSVLLGGNPRATRWLEAEEGKSLGGPIADMELLTKEKSLRVELWHRANGWIGRIDGGYFEWGPDMAAFLDTIRDL